MKRCLTALILLLALTSARSSDDELSALSLADQPAAEAAPNRPWQMFLELGAGRALQRNPANSLTTDRHLSLDFRYDQLLSNGWRTVFADRIDINQPAQRPGIESTINTLKEAYLSKRLSPYQLIDFGRIDARQGVSLGYNPTDYFRAGALRSVTSIDPISLKKNRQGSAMIRGQTFWDSGSVTALYSPKLAKQPSEQAFDLNWGATNNRNRWLLTATQRLGEAIAPQWLLYKEEGTPVQLGFNRNYSGTPRRHQIQ